MVEVRYRLTLEDVMALQKNSLTHTKLHNRRKICKSYNVYLYLCFHAVIVREGSPCQ